MFRKKKFKKKYFNKPVEETSECMPTTSSSRLFSSKSDNRPPPGLRGRELGLWHRDRRIKMKTELGDTQNVIPLNIPRERETRIKSLLDSLDSKNLQRLNYDIKMGLEEDKPEDIYPKEYVDMVRVSFDEKLNENVNSKWGHKLRDNLEINRTLKTEYDNLQNNARYLHMLDFRKRLPTYKMKNEILKLIHDNQVIVLSGETGCGKSTQVPQLIIEEACKQVYGSQVNICVTQPRRIAAISLAHRVASERGEDVGDSVGYAIRLESVPPRLYASITYMTTGVLLKDLEVAPALQKYSHVIVDEVHERDADIDLVLICLKKVMLRRPDLKVILMSATIEADKLSSYYGNCPCIHIPGLAYPVKDYYLEDVLQVTRFKFEQTMVPKKRRKHFLNMSKQIQMHRMEIGPFVDFISRKYDTHVLESLMEPASEAINLDLILELLKYIIKKGDGAILIFLPGMNDITKMLKMMEKSGHFPRSRYDIYPLHSKLPTLDQSRIFQAPPRGIRKIVVATNIAETSITIDDVVFVIDGGKIKLTGYNPDDGISSLMPEWVSESNLRQRRGRAGRVQPGECWHLLSGYRRTKLLQQQSPELCRASLIEPVLTIKRLRMGNAEQVLAEAPDPPNIKTVQKAIKDLTELGALDTQERLTPLGWHLARLPLTPRGGKLLILGALFSCFDPVAAVAACWGFKEPFVCPIGKERDAAKAKILLSLGEPSDHFAVYNSIRRWENTIDDEPVMANDFTFRNFLSKNTLYMLRDMRRQFATHMKQMGFIAKPDVDLPDINVNSSNRSLFKALVAAALYPNVANVRVKIKSNRSTMITRLPEGRVVVHPSSILGSDVAIHACVGSAHYLVYTLLQRTTGLFIFDVSAVHALPLVFFSNDVIVKPDGPDHCIISSIQIEGNNYFLNWRATRQTTALITQLRRELHCLLARHVLNPQPLSHSSEDAIILKALVELITAEDDPDAYPNQEDDDEDDDVIFVGNG